MLSSNSIGSLALSAGCIPFRSVERWSKQAGKQAESTGRDAVAMAADDGLPKDM